MPANYDDRILRRSIDKLKELTGKDNETVLKEVSLSIAKKAVAFTPPKNKKEGETTLRRDIDKLYIDSDRLISWAESKGNVAVAKRINDVVKRQDYGALQSILRNSPHMSQVEVTEFTPALHAKNRDSRGRVNLRKPRYFFTNEGAVMSYRKEEKKRVGYAKSSFAGWVRAFGGSVPQWIGRFANNTVDDNSARALLPNITMKSLVGYINSLADRNNVIQRAVDNGAKNIVTRAKYLLQKSKKQAGFK